MREAKVQAQCPTVGLFSVQSTPRLATKHIMLNVNWIMHIFPGKLFDLLLSNLSSCPVHLSKHTVTGHAFKALERILTVDALKFDLLQSKKERKLLKCWAVLTTTAFNSAARTKSSEDSMSIWPTKKNPYGTTSLAFCSRCKHVNESLDKTAATKYHIDLKRESRLAFQHP